MALILHVTAKDVVVIGDSIVNIKESRKGRMVLCIDAPKDILIRRVKKEHFNADDKETLNEDQN